MADDKKPDGWQVHDRQQRRAWLRLTYRQRLDWLWQAKQFAERVRQARRAPRPADK